MALKIGGAEIERVFCNDVQLDNVYFNGTRVYTGRVTQTRSYHASTDTTMRYGKSPSESPIPRGSVGAVFVGLKGAALEARGSTFYYTIDIPLYWYGSSYEGRITVSLEATVDGVQRTITFPAFTKAAGRGVFRYRGTATSSVWLGECPTINVRAKYTLDYSYNYLYTWQMGNSASDYGSLTMSNYAD